MVGLISWPFLISKFLLYFNFWSFLPSTIILHYHTNISVSGFWIVHVKVLGGHPKDKRRQLKPHTTFCVQQEALGNTCDFLVSINMVAFGAQPNYVVSVSAFILLYCCCLWLNIYINLLLILNSHFIVWQDYENAFINAAGSSLEHIRERLVSFIVLQIILI
jgi:hypothetical protein